MARPSTLFSGLVVLAVILTATIGLGFLSVMFDDSLPADDRYTTLFQAVLSRFGHSLGGPSITGDLIGAALIILLFAGLFTTIANLTTGTTISSSRFNNATITFTPNLNVTGSIGFVPMIQLIPITFGALVLLTVYSIFERHLPGGL